MEKEREMERGKRNNQEGQGVGEKKGGQVWVSESLNSR